jgi:hypothetical protein
MIRFFRKIRQSLLLENKFSKYLLYAVGEIILVMIGILLALQVNNWNTQKVQEEKTDLILRKMQRDLLADISQAKQAISFYRQKDSLVQVIRAGNLTPESLAINGGELLLIERHFHDVKIHKAGYKQYTTHIAELPFLSAKIEESQLDELYIENVAWIEAFANDLVKFVDEDTRYRVENFSWFSSHFYGKNNMEQGIDYILNNPRYKNQLYMYRVKYVNLTLHLKKFVHAGVALYTQIEEQLGNENPLPDVVQNESLSLSPKQLAAYTGKFSLVEGELYGGYIVYFKDVEVTNTDRNLIWAFPALTEPSKQLMFSSYLPHESLLYAQLNNAFYMNGTYNINYQGMDTIILMRHMSMDSVVFVRE